jgi:enoyl-CoA hydratase
VDLNNLRYEVNSGVALVTLDRPQKRNALSPAMLGELSLCLDAADHDESVAALVVTGGENVFSAGMDLEEMAKLSNGEVESFWTMGYNRTYEKLYNFRVPTIAAVSGYCLAGGFDLAISCDFRFASEASRFGQLEVNVGLTPGIERLWRLVGLSRAKYLGMTGDIIDVQEAYRIGLADRVVKTNEVVKEARSFASAFAAKPRLALEKAKRSYNAVLDMDHRSAIEWETRLLTELLSSDEARRIMQRFLQK